MTRVAAGNLCVIYYGWLIADASGAPNRAAAAIARARPRVLIAAFSTLQPRLTNLSPQVRELLQASGALLFAYVPTGYGARDLADVKAEAAGCLAGGADGIFYDEVPACPDEAQLASYQALHALVKERGGRVIANAGVDRSDESLMRVADILMVEHQWRTFGEASPWRAGYPPERFMGVSSNEPGADAFLEGAIDRQTAVRDTRAAWACGVGWHYSTDRYVELPAWFADYVRALRKN